MRSHVFGVSAALCLAIGLLAPASAQPDNTVRASDLRPGPDILYWDPPRAPQLENTGVWEAAVGDSYLLCSDGLHGYLKLEEIAPILAEGGHFSATRLIELANARGGKDNITAIIVEVC